METQNTMNKILAVSNVGDLFSVPFISTTTDFNLNPKKQDVGIEGINCRQTVS